MGKKAIERWLDEVLKKYKLDASEESRLDQEIEMWKKRIEFWDKYIEHLEKVRGAIRPHIEGVLQLCRKERDSLWLKQRDAEAKRTRGLLYSTLKDYIDEIAVW